MKKRVVILVLLAVTLLALMGCGGKEKVVVGSKNFTEQYIVAEMISRQLEEAGYKVERKFGMSSFALRQALVSGQIDICADYTGTAWTAYLKQEGMVRDQARLFEQVAQMDSENGILWSHRMPLNNTYALAVTRENAEKWNLNTLEDLAALESERAHPAFCQTGVVSGCEGSYGTSGAPWPPPLVPLTICWPASKMRVL